MNFEDNSLTLGLGFPSPTTLKTNHPDNHHSAATKPPQMVLRGGELPSLTLSLSSERKVVVTEEPRCTAVSATSSLSNVAVSVKRERETSSGSDDVDIEEEDGTSHVNATRKKLRLTKKQSVMLEESFKQQITLNPKQKQALADRLNLRPRQVEVWFQNRRARTKLKQTEVDCEYMKKWCETLRDENKRLQKEVQELKALKLAHQQPFHMNLLPAAATLTMCPSCEQIGATVSPTVPTTPFVMGPKSHFYAAAPNCPLLVDN